MRYRKKPIEIEAIQWKGDNQNEIKEFAGDCAIFDDFGEGQDNLLIKSLEGTLQVPLGHYVVKGHLDEFYPVDDKAFHQTYEAIDE